ncbi:MAG: hypothetical protein FWD73_08235 [Polyangiaceae bacterium]|nr:hypothetical protein [Polyangiaceae bacterium]
MIWFLSAVLSLLAWRVVSRWIVYRRVFSDPHLMELASAAPRLRTAALDLLDYPPYGPNDPRAFLTSAGIGVLYTITKENDCFVHHCSVSLSGGVTPGAVGRRFIAACVRLFDLPADKVEYVVGVSTVHHARAMLSLAEHEALVFKYRPPCR